MNDSVEISTALLRKFAEFTRKLSPEQLVGVATGELKFGLLDPPVKKAAPAPKAPPVDLERVGVDLLRMTSREDAVSYIDKLRLGVADLKSLAKSVGASLVGVTKKDEFRDRIVEHTVGHRLDSHAIRDGAWASS